MKKLKVVQIGTGHAHASAPISSLKKRRDIDFLGYVKIKDDKETFDGIPELDYDEVLKIKDLDAVFIETEDRYLNEYAYEFVKRGIAVQMDKPGGQDKSSFDALFDLAKEKKVPLHLGYMYRYNPAINKAIEMVKNGELGEIYYVEAQMNCFHKASSREQWLKGYSGGMMNFLGCHLVDLILRIQGVPDEIIPCNSSSGNGLTDMGFAVFKYGDKASFIKSTAVESSGFMRRNIVVCGQKGTIEITPTEYYPEGSGTVQTDMYVSLIEDKGKDWNYRPQKKVYVIPDRYDDMYDEFFRIVRGEIENPYTYEYEKTLHDVLLRACGIKA